jgi:ferredoxin
MKAMVNRDICTGCGLCAQTCEEVFEMGDDERARVKESIVPKALEKSCREACHDCPVDAITISDQGETTMGIERTLRLAAVAVTVLAATLSAAQDFASRWTLTQNGSGRYTAAVYRDATAADAQVNFKLGDNGSPVSGTIRIVATGLDRAVSDGELRVYWEAFGGAEVLWNALQTAGKLEVVASPGDVPTPPAFVGPVVRAITSDGLGYIGTIVRTHEAPNWFVEEIDTHPVYIFTPAVTSLQRMNSTERVAKVETRTP